LLCNAFAEADELGIDGGISFDEYIIGTAGGEVKG
jgi:hypothetical protein